MALIGTISGSVGVGGGLVSATAISGTLIIADAPPSSFPTLPSGVKLYVSGTRGADVDSASALFGGDVFMSGALGLQEYLQLRSINNKRFPTATTASYIYTSGSTNDLYFTQFSGSMRNDVRLRWLEGSLTTGLLNGGVISTANGTTTFSVTSGAGIIIAQNAAITSEPYPTVTYVKWPAFVSASLDYSGSAQITYVAVDSAGALTQLNTPPTLAQYKDRIVLGRVLHQTGSVSNGAINSPAMAYAVSSNTFDFIRPFGPLKVSGHVLAASGSTLGLTKTAGDSYTEGRNYAFDPSSPNTILAADDPDLINCKIFYQHVSGSTTITNTGTGNAGFDVIDRAQYNNNGTLAAVGNSEWTNQRVYWFPRSVNRALFVYYGSAKYGTLLEAVAGLLTENFVEGDNTKGAAIYVGSVSVKGNEISLANTTNVRITQGGLFRASGGGGGGGGGSTPPAGSTTQVQFNDAGAFGGDANFTFNNVTHALTVVGNITGSRFTSNTAGSLAIGGGQVYLNGASSNRIDFSSQGTGNPEFNAPTAGTKVVLYPAAGASATDYAIGISPAVLWQSIPSTDTAMMFKWFGGTTTLAALSGSGNMEISGDLAVNGGDLTTTAGTFNLVDATATTVNFARGASEIVAGASGGSTTFQGNITGSNMLLTSGFIVTGSGIIESNTSTTAFRVTQQGAGNAIAVEDSKNPDATPFVVTADGRVGIGTAIPAAYVFVSGTDLTIPTLVAKGPDVTVNTLTVTSSAGANTSVGFVNIDQGNYASKYGLTITNIGTGKSGLKLAANTTGGSFSIENMNTTPTIYMTQKNLWFESVSTAFDTSKITYKFIENNKAVTYTDQKTFLISGNTNGPKTGSYFEVEKSGSLGPIKLLELQGDTTDNALFVSGAFLTSGSVTIAGDLAVNGGDITTTASTFNLITGSATTVNFAQAANAINIGKLTGGSAVVISSILTGSNPAFFGDSVTIGGPSQANILTTKTTATLYNTVATTVNIGGSATTVSLGASTGRTTVNNDLAITTGNIIGAPGSPSANVMTLISSGNIIAKLDIDKSADGHKFIVQDGNGIEQFSVGENGNAEVSGSFVVSGSTTFGSTVERLITSTGGTGTVTFDTTFGSIFYVNNPSGDVLANFTNVPTANNNRVVTTTVILSQSATARIVNGVQVNGTSGSILWANKVTPTGTVNQQDVFGFSLIRSGSIWTILGQMSTYG